MHSCHTRKERSELAEWETGSLLGETFPNGVNYKIGSSSLTEDWNYIQWSVFGGTLIRPAVAAGPTINNWTVCFDLQDSDVKGTSSTAIGKSDAFSKETKYSDLPLVVVVNGQELEPWIIPCV